MNNILTVKNLEKFYGNKGNITKAVNDISFTVSEGEYIGIMGASGSGKTTLLNCVSTIDRATAGHIYIDRKDVTTLKSAQLSKFRREKLGFIFQDFNLLDTLTAFENIALALTILKTNPKEIENRVKNVAELLSITDVLSKYPYQMSVFSFYTSKEEIRQSSVTTKAVVSFLAIYLGIVFMITCAAILAIQQLSEVSDNRHRYSLLKKLGVSQKELNKALFRQILCYFAMPLSLAVVHSAVGLTAANEVIKMVGKINIASSIAATAIFVVAIYGVYFFATYLGCKSIITKETN